MENIHLQIENLLYENATDLEVAKFLKKEIKSYFETLDSVFEISGGKDFLVKHTLRIDELLKLIYKVAQREMFGDYMPMKNSLPIALVALGSYGREQLCVYSDIDLMIVYKKVSGYNMEQMIEKILYILWDTGLKIGHRVHEVDELLEVSRTDTTIKTALIESRLVQGSLFLWTEVENAIAKIRYDDPKKFIEAKLEEQRQKHKKFPLTMEPNLKDGEGGFRDANLVFWIGKVLYNSNNIKNLPFEVIRDSDYRAFGKVLEFLFRVRSALHLASGKKEDRLRLDLIPEVARYLGYKNSQSDHMKLASKVTGALKSIRLYSKIWLEILTSDYRLYDTQGAMRVIHPNHTLEDLDGVLQQLTQSATEPFVVHPTFLQKLIHVPLPKELTPKLYTRIGEIFYQEHAYSILSTLSFAKCLYAVIPPIAKVVNLPQFDGYHQYAVDIHSLQCLRHVESIQDSAILELFNALDREEQRVLKIVIFLHDAGKGRVTDHHMVGVILFRRFANALLIEKSLIEMGEQLILHHTLMSKVAQREDLYNEKVILKFATHFPSKKLLDMIYILTYADMSGVGNGVYNNFSAKLIKTLYQEAVDALQHQQILSETAKRVEKEGALKRYEPFLALKRSEQNKILSIPYNLLFIKYTPSEIVEISKRALALEEFSYEISNEGHLSIEILHQENFSLLYLLRKLSSLKVIQMNTTKLFNATHYCKIEFAEEVTQEDRELIAYFLTNAFKEQKIDSSKPLANPIVQKDIILDDEHSKDYAALYIKTKDQKGLLAFMIESFKEIGLQISSAKIHTFKGYTKDIFLIKKDRNFRHNTQQLIKKLTGTA
jgi:[protein-PII] uridylyltransferase